MSHVQCYFCSRPNAADAMFCEACGGQLSLRPCPGCEAVNDATAELCYACKRELARAAVEDSSAGNEDVGSSDALSERRPDYARIGLVRDDAVPVGNAVVTLEQPHAARAGNATLFKRRMILAVAGVCVLVAIGIILFASTRVLIRAPAPAGATGPTQSAAPADSAPPERTGTVEAESAAAAASKETSQEPITSEGSASAMPSVDAKPATAPRETRVEAKQTVEPPPARGRLESTAAVGAVGATSGSVAACDPGVVALGLCASESGEAPPAARPRSSPEMARRSNKDEQRPQCDEAAAALALCPQ
jgi:hypothetical protein